LIRNHTLAFASMTVLAMASASAAYAQETTGAIRGTVVGADGAGLANVPVTVEHVPSGTKVTVTTTATGSYVARGLRLGGPYTVSAEGLEEQISSISLGGAVEVNLAAGAVVEAIEVSGRRTTNDFGTGGSTTNIGSEQIADLPSISRDLKDVARLDPFALINDPSNDDAFSFAGVNTRLNQLTIDGIRQNDEFGLNNNGYPTQRSPISLDAVESVSVSAAPFSVINNGFIGGSINAVTKSGTNEFHGSIFYERSNDDLIGDSYTGFDNRTRVNNVNNPNYGQIGLVPYRRVFDETVWGASLGGPIIQNKLFFFASYEKFESEFSLEEGPADGGFSTDIPRITPAAIAAFQAATQARYNYDTGSFVNLAPPVQDEKYIVKVDWNITDEHRLALTFQETVGDSFNGATGSVFVGGNSVTQPRIGLESGQYFKDERLTTYNAQLNSQWTENFSTEFRASYKETETSQIPFGGLTVGQVTVNVADLPGVLPGSGTPQIQFGADNFRHDNYLYSENTNFELIGRYNYGSHDILAGVRTEARDFLNVFVSQSLGTWGFNSYADYLAGRVGSFFLRGAVDPAGGAVPATFGTARGGAVEFGYDLNSLYIEDNYQASDNLRLSFGARYDWFSMSDRPENNANFATRQGFANTSNLDGRDLIMPRFGFDWDVDDKLTVTGGIGRFSAIGTNVQVGNPFGNDGARITSATGCNLTVPVTDLTRVPAGCTFTPGSGNVVALDRNFEIPSAWKTNVAARREFTLPFLGDFSLGGDLIYTSFENALYYKDIRAVQIGTAPDGRPVYGRGTTGVTAGNEWDLLLTNLKDGGDSKAVAVSFSKFLPEGLFQGTDINAVYTYTEAKDGNPMTSSQPDSSYVRFASTDHNNPRLTTSDYETRHRFAVNINWERELWKNNPTSVTIFAQHRSGLPYSFVYHASRSGNFDNDFGNAVPQSYSGAFGTSNQLFYVPQVDANGLVTATSDPRVTFAGATTANTVNLDQFNAFLKSTGLLKYAGRVAPRNAFRGDGVNTVDVRITQEIAAPYVPGGKFKAYVDIENFGNLLNNKWGVVEQYPFYRGVGTVDVSCVAPATPGTVVGCATPGAVFRYQSLQQPATQLAGSPTGVARRPLQLLPASVWQVKLGVRFEF